jgi:pimeloyl-ACP methyl ester carboxylesterase
MGDNIIGVVVRILNNKLCAGLLSLFITLPVSQCNAGVLDLLYQNKLDETQQSLFNDNIEEGSFKQAIDHHNPDIGFFGQRYYFDNRYALSNKSPVFFYICGESTCRSSRLQGAIRAYAEEHHAFLIALEHRYYGKSIPNYHLTIENLAYLYTDAAIEDLYYFQKAMIKEKDLKGKWVAFGGSYPGSLSAYYRLRHPEMVVGALASSAPVMAKENFEEYDAHVTSVAGEACANQMRAVVKEVEQAIDTDPQRYKEIKHLFAANEVNHPIDFLYLIADVGAYAVQYGDHQRFCSALTNGSAIEAYAAYARELYDRYGVSALYFTFEGAKSEDPHDYANGLGIRQWYYQSCTEYGYWQTANSHRALSTRSAKIDLDYHHEVCQRLFGIGEAAHTEAMNQQFYYPLILSASNIYFTNGSNDPWSKLSLLPENGNAENQNLFYHLISDASHCEDLHYPQQSDSIALKEVRADFDRLLSEWLSYTENK